MLKTYLSFILSALLCITTTVTGAEKDETSSPLRWPTQVPVPQSTRLREMSNKKADMEGFCYYTKNYLFSSPVELDEHAQENAGRLFECAFAANQAVARVLPIIRSKKNRTPSTRLKAIFYKNMEDYIEAGAPASSIGLFRCRMYDTKRLTEKSIVSDEVLVPFESLGFSEEGKVIKEHIDSHTLVHEITHQCTCLNQLPVWANEGMSEYIGYVPYDGEVLDFDKCFENIVEQAKLRGEALHFPFSLHDFFLMSQEDMYEHMGNRKDTYMLSTLCICYFVHLNSRAGVLNIQNYFKYLMKGKDNDDALVKLFGRIPPGESMQSTFIKAWEEQGVTLQFAEDGYKR